MASRYSNNESMAKSSRRLTVAGAVFGVLCAASVAPQGQNVRPPSDLDAFMGKVLARRDENWKKLQQYVLDEREQIEIHATGNIPIWGETRDYTWYLREGFFVRSPVKVNGVNVPDAERRDYEANYLRR